VAFVVAVTRNVSHDVDVLYENRCNSRVIMTRTIGMIDSASTTLTARRQWGSPWRVAMMNPLTTSASAAMAPRSRTINRMMFMNVC